jgi:hypothetical protein
MIWLIGPKSREFSYINYLAVKTAASVQKPDAIFLYCNKEPENNPHWEMAKQYVQLVHIQPPEEFEGVPLHSWPQYQADVIRLQKLYELGGIYLDTDSILLRPLDDLMDHDVVLSGAVKGFTPEVREGVDSISAGVMLSKPKAKFFEIWLSRLADGLRKDLWAWHAVNLPAVIAQERPELLHLLPQQAFTPFDFLDTWVWEERGVDALMARFDRPYAAHMWDSVWVDHLKKVDANYLKSVDNSVTRLLTGQLGLPAK